LLCPPAPLFVHRIAFVDRGIVGQGDGWHRVLPERYLIKKGITSSRVEGRC
jgi:hypothetical protein